MNRIPEVHGAMLTLEDVININKTTVPFEIEVRFEMFHNFIEFLYLDGSIRRNTRTRRDSTVYL